MIRYRLGAGAASVRWAMSPIHEVVSLARLLTEPQRHPMFHPWLRRRHRRLSEPDLSALTVFMADGAYRPDFLDPSPMSSEPTFEEGMDALLAAPADQTYAELVDAARGRGTETVRRLLDDPGRARSEAADALRRLWKAVVEPEWPSMRQALRAEMLDRAVQVNREGLRAVLPRLHHSAACEGDTITVGKTVDIDVDCPEGLILVPSLFITDRMQCTTSDHWTPAIYYPASGRYLWTAPPTPRSLDRLLGATRSRILAALTTPLQTTVVARLVGVTAPTASEHLAILRDAGLIDSSRTGRTATHELTEAGRALLDAASPRP
ncbi:transcriptional regulator [Planomonospora parontospora subsp. parontospora]|uniref:Transcriptional regulator n=2 Tax=Planomonospora parontospora TaxID=58119 RepID=A0AA37F3D3_9ACTN|nr:transcriptional regulator [Planomonospora parontospora]GII07715.1 transcriptional regulator [Planomonospora parontospora subsp. parontospora]